MSVSVEASSVPVAADDYQLIQPPAQLDPRILVALARLIMDGQVMARPHTAALMALTVMAWALDRFLIDSPAPPPLPGPIAASPGADQPEAGVLLHAAASLARRDQPVEGLPEGVQGALPPVNWSLVLQVVVAILKQLMPLLVNPR